MKQKRRSSVSRNARSAATIDASKLAVLFGAGISHGAPTSLPIASQMTDAIWKAAVRHVRRSWEGVVLPDRPRRAPQFEVLMDCVAHVRAGAAARLVEIFDRERPNANHRLLAMLGAHGARLATTNFDCNVEVALQAVGACPIAVAGARQLLPRAPSRGQVPLLKLHGCVSRPKTLIWSATALARGGSHASVGVLSKARTAALAATLSGRVCVAVGYSGSDRVDVVPALAGLLDTRVIFAQHDARRSAPTSSQAVNLLKSTGRRSRRLGRWYDVKVTVGDTTKFLASLAAACGIAARAVVRPVVRPARLTRVDRVLGRLSAAEALFLVLGILHADDDVRSVVRVVRQALQHEIPPKLRFELMINEVLFTKRGRDAARAFRMLLSNLAPPVNPAAESVLLRHAADALDETGAATEAAREAAAALDAAVRAGRRDLELECRNLMGLILQRRSRPAPERRTNRMLAAAFRSTGDSESQAQALNNDGVRLARHGRWAAAEARFLRAAGLWRFVRAREQALEAELNAANCHFRLGDGAVARATIHRILASSRRFPLARGLALLLDAEDRITRCRQATIGMRRILEAVALLEGRFNATHLLRDVLSFARGALADVERDLKSGRLTETRGMRRTLDALGRVVSSRLRGAPAPRSPSVPPSRLSRASPGSQRQAYPAANSGRHGS